MILLPKPSSEMKGICRCMRYSHLFFCLFTVYPPISKKAIGIYRRVYPLFSNLPIYLVVPSPHQLPLHHFQSLMRHRSPDLSMSFWLQGPAFFGSAFCHAPQLPPCDAYTVCKCTVRNVFSEHNPGGN